MEIVENISEGSEADEFHGLLLHLREQLVEARDSIRIYKQMLVERDIKIQEMQQQLNSNKMTELVSSLSENASLIKSLAEKQQHEKSIQSENSHLKMAIARMDKIAQEKDTLISELQGMLRKKVESEDESQIDNNLAIKASQQILELRHTID